MVQWGVMKKRLFVSVPLSLDMREVLGEYQQRFSLEGIRWVAPENLHVTVFFCGDVNEEDVPKLDAALKVALTEQGPFELTWRQLLFGPPGKDPRMVWGEFQEDEAFGKLVHTVHEAVRPYLEPDIKPPRKKLIPHITMARFKDPRVARGVELEQPDLNTLPVRSCELMASELTAHGSLYTVLATYAFT